MNDSRERFCSRYVALEVGGQIVYLAKLADRLTLLARDTYDRAADVVDARRLRIFNEAQNRILGQLVRLLTADDNRYPNEVFANVLADQFQMLGLNADDFVPPT
jgi:hypothetical protein